VRRRKNPVSVGAAAIDSTRSLAWRARTAASLAIVLAGAFAYANSFDGVFVLDDEPAIARNENLRSLTPLARAVSAPPDTTLSGRPVATFSFAVDTALRGGTLAAYHETNLAIHLLTTLLLFAVIRRTLETESPRIRFSEHSTALAFFVALLFVVHPLQTSAVTYIVQRVESLAALLVLATLYGAIRSAATAGRAATFWAAFAVMSCALAMGTKETAVVAPVLVLLWDWIFLEEKPKRRTLLLALLFATWAILATLVASVPRGLSAGFGFAEWPWWSYLITQTTVVAHYVRLVFLPAPLVFDYGWPKATLAEAVVPGFLLAAMFVATVVLVVRRRPLSFPLAWFFILLAPSSSVVPIVTEIAAEHRMYLPLAGILSIAVIGAASFWNERSGALSPAARRAGSVACVAAALVAAGLLGRMTYARNEDYRDYDRLWSKTVAERPENPRARINLASSFLTQGRYVDAEEHLRAAVRLDPDSAEAHANLGVALASQGRELDGVPMLRRAVALAPDFIGARRNLAEALAVAGDFAEAARVAREAVIRARALGDARAAAEIDARASDYARDALRSRP
jgi:protein O-mannosyl-transferase